MTDVELAQIAVAVATLADENISMAAEARLALAWIMDEQGLDMLTQERIQNFCWYDLPVSWGTDLTGKVQVTEALARALDLLGLNRYAAICRSEKTLNILRSYENSVPSGITALRRASAASGITPPDLPEFKWGEAMGLQEAAAWWSVSGSLELAIMAGDLQPGKSGWRPRQQAITRASLNAPRAEFFGQTAAQMIIPERISAWLNIPCSETRRDILSGTCDRLRQPASPVGYLLPGLRWLLEQFDEGIRLTRAGNLNRVFVQRNAGRFCWSRPNPPRTESDVPELHWLHQFASRLRLTRRRGSAVWLSAEGRRLLAGAPRQLWHATAAGLLQGRDFDVYVGELFLGLVLEDDQVESKDLHRLIRAAVKEEDFRERRTGESPNDDDIAVAIAGTSDLCRCLGLLADADLKHLGYSFTDTGRATALEALRIKATGPRGFPRGPVTGLAA